MSSPAYPTSPASVPVMVAPSVTAVPLAAPGTLGSKSALVICPRCSMAIQTSTKEVCGTKTWVWSVIGCLFGSGICACLFPFCCSCSKDIEHTCPSCGYEVGVFEKEVC